MRKYLAVILLAVLTAVCVPAVKAQVGGGILLGGVASQIDGDSWAGYKKIGLAFGGFAWYAFNDRWMLQPEISFGHRGSREVVAGYGQFSLNFIDVPIMLRYKVLEKNQVAIFPEAGLSANVLLKATNGFKPLKVDNTSFYSRFNVEGHLGAAATFSERVSIYGRWSVGLNNLWAFTPQPWMTIHYVTLGVRLGFMPG